MRFSVSCCTVQFLLLALVIGSQPALSLSELRQSLRGAQPGARLVLAGGVHEGSLSIEGLRGTKARPIVLAGENPQDPPVIRGGGSGIHLIAPEHVVIEDLIVERATGNGINVDDGGDLRRPARGVVLRHVRVRDIGPKGNCDGIKLSGVADFKVEHCTIERWGSDGSGIDMVGCANGLVVDCELRHSDTAGASGMQMKGGTHDVTVQSCRFEHAGRRALNVGGSTGLQFFRPEPRGYEAAGIIVEGCTIVGSEAAVAFVGVDGADFRFNTVYLPTRWALRILQETRAEGFVPSRNGRVTDNVIVLKGPSQIAANVGDKTDAASFTFARNVWFWEQDPDARPRLPSEETAGTYGQDPKLSDPANGSFIPAGDGPASRAGATGLTTRLR